MRKAIATVILLLWFVGVMDAADWPMWRYDAARGAASPGEIAPAPALLWSRKLPPVRQAWPLEPHQRINFDASYEPVVMGKLLFLGSPNDGSVTAYSTDTGEKKWTFFTEGPVRCAPACWKGKLYVGSDDGYLYCLDAGTGAVVWKSRGAPADRPDRRQLGNGHLVSFWPVRGGPVVANGVVYFGAGIWPIFGVFLRALDAETGQVKWTNANLNYIAHVRIDHEDFSDVGLSPQGYLVAIADRLVVPCGRSMPAGLELSTGKLIYYAQGFRNGDSRVAAHGQYAFVGRDGAVNLFDLREASSKWVGAGTTVPEGYRNGPSSGQGGSSRFDLFESPFLPYKDVEGCNASSAFEKGVAYGSANGTFYAYDLNGVKLVMGDGNAYGVPVKVPKWRPTLLWQYKTPFAGLAGGPVIKAGSRLYGHAGRKLVAVENLREAPRIAWEKDIDGVPTSLVAADSKLFVATAEGAIYCYGQGQTGKAYDLKPATPNAGSDEWGAKAGDLVKASGVKSGYCLVLGLAEGRLVEELLKQTELIVLGVDADPKKVDALRRRFSGEGFYGSRVELFASAPFEFLFPPYIASLIVSEDAKAAGFSEKTDAAKLFNILRPYGGALCLDLPADELLKWANSAALPNVLVKREGGMALMVREGALPGSAPWTHEAADAARTFCSQDDLVKAPLGFLWYGDTNGFAQEHDYGVGVKAQVNGGRVYALQQHQPRALFSYDAYTGRFLWKNEIKPFHARFAALSDGIYLVADGKCIVYGPQTGKTLNTFTFNAAGATTAKDLRVDGDIIVVLCDDTQEKKVPPNYWNYGYYNGAALVCLDRKTGAELWRRSAKNRFGSRALAIQTGTVFCVDSIPITPQNDGKKPPSGVIESESLLYALDSRTGKELWSKKIAYKCPDVAYSSRDDWVSFSSQTGLVIAGKYRFANAWNAQSGKVAWENKPLDGRAVMLRGKELIEQNMAVYDVLTGDRTPKVYAVHNYGCNYVVAGKHLLFYRDTSAAYAEINTRKIRLLRNTRSGCSNSLIAADGLLNVPNFSWGCVCNYAVQTSFAMMYMPEVDAWCGSTPVTLAPPSASPVRELKGKIQ